MICRAQSSFYVASAEHIKNIILFTYNLAYGTIYKLIISTYLQLINIYKFT